MTQPGRIPAAATAMARREAWIDNLRVTIITGVIGAHVALIYALDVGWYYQERTASAAAKAALAGLFAPGLLFGMGLMFFVAGMFTPRALAAKGPGRFVTDRAIRLGLPVLAYLFVVDPAMNLLGDRAMGVGEGIGDYVRRSLLDDVELGVSWFIAALLLFSVGFALWRQRHPALERDRSQLRMEHIAVSIAVIAVGSFVVRLAIPFLGTDALAGSNVWEYPQMVTLFALGALAAERGWFVGSGLPPAIRRTCGRLAAVSLVAVIALAVGIAITDDADPFLGGLRLEATIIPVLEASIAVSMALWLTDWFRRRWDRTTPVVHAAGRASFAAYLIHAPVTIALAALLRGVGAPAELKFVTVYAGTVAVAFGLGWLLSRSRLGSRIL